MNKQFMKRKNCLNCSKLSQSHNFLLLSNIPLLKTHNLNLNKDFRENNKKFWIQSQ